MDYFLTIINCPFLYILDLICPRLSDPRNGNVTYAYGYAGETALYSCYHGYRLVGTSSRVCQATEIWGGSQPDCSRMLNKSFKVLNSLPANCCIIFGDMRQLTLQIMHKQHLTVLNIMYIAPGTLDSAQSTFQIRLFNSESVQFPLHFKAD